MSEDYAVTFIVAGPESIDEISALRTQIQSWIPTLTKVDLAYDPLSYETVLRVWTNDTNEAAAVYCKIKTELKDGELSKGTVRMYQSFRKWGH